MTIAILSHRRPKQPKTTLLREWAAEEGNIPLWLFEEAYHTVGDLAEAIALVVPESTNRQSESLSYWIDLIISLGKEVTKPRKLLYYLPGQMDTAERFVFNKLITGGFRMGLSQKLMTRALSKHTGIEESELAHRLMGDWTPQKTTFEELILES